MQGWRTKGKPWGRAQLVRRILEAILARVCPLSRHAFVRNSNYQMMIEAHNDSDSNISIFDIDVKETIPCRTYLS